MPSMNNVRLLEGAIFLFLAAATGLHFVHLFGAERSSIDWIWVTLAFTFLCLLHGIYLLGTKAGFVFFGVGVAFGLFFEVLSINTGFPFGPYYYTDKLGPKVLEVPFIIPLAWFAVAYMTGSLANLIVDRRPMASGGWGKLVWLSLIGAWCTSAFDLSADPYFVQDVGAWVMDRPGPYFGEEFRGVFGWALVGTTISLVFRAIHRRIGSRPRKSVSRRMAVVPVAGYGVWMGFFIAVGEPEAVRLIAVFAMGLPIMAALSGLASWPESSDDLSFPGR